MAAVSATVIRRARRDPHLAVGWFWFLGVLVPAIGLVQVGVQSMADRYMYLPLIGLTIMLCWSVPSRVMERWDLKLITCDVAAALIAVCAALSRVQVEYWKDSETLFRYAVDVTRDNWLAHSNLGVALAQTGEIEEAITQYEEALRIEPDLADAHYNLGIALARVGRMPEAIEQLEYALQIDPDLAEAHNNLGIDLAQSGRIPEAIEHLERALRIQPDLAEAHYNLGIALVQAGRIEDAISHYQQALRIKPDYIQAQNAIALLKARP